QNLYLNFSSKGESNDLMFLENYKELEKSSLLKIASNIKERNYISLAINSFNNEIAQLMLKFDFKEDLNKIDGKDDSGSKSEIKVFKDYFDFYGLTNKKEYNFINSFLNFNILDNIYFSTNERMKKI
ncbi:hypothetical protein NRA01_18470, partial [Acinetobacter baumannii]|nr:hypothetical protein [Acinetobacter baumannii]